MIPAILANLETEIAKLRALPEPTGHIHVAIGGVQTALDNLQYHLAAVDRALAAQPAPAASAPTAPTAS